MKTRCGGLAAFATVIVLLAGCVETDVTTVVRSDGSAERRIRQVSGGGPDATLNEIMQLGLRDYQLPAVGRATEETVTFRKGSYVRWLAYNLEPGTGKADVLFRTREPSRYGFDLAFENWGPRIELETRGEKTVAAYRESVVTHNAARLAARQIAHSARVRAAQYEVTLTDEDEQDLAGVVEQSTAMPEFSAYLAAIRRSWEWDLIPEARKPAAEQPQFDPAERKLTGAIANLMQKHLVAKGVSDEKAGQIAGLMNIRSSEVWEDTGYAAPLYFDSFLYRVQMPGRIIETNGIQTGRNSVAWAFGGPNLLAQKIQFYALSEVE